MMKRISFVTSLIASIAFCTSALAQQYPTKNITMLVPYAAGGPTDTVARVIAQAMGKPLGQTIIVENRPSAGGILRSEEHTSELQSRLHLVCRLLLEKKKTQIAHRTDGDGV